MKTWKQPLKILDLYLISIHSNISIVIYSQCLCCTFMTHTSSWQINSFCFISLRLTSACLLQPVCRQWCHYIMALYYLFHWFLYGLGDSVHLPSGGKAYSNMSDRYSPWQEQPCVHDITASCYTTGKQAQTKQPRWQFWRWKRGQRNLISGGQLAHSPCMEEFWSASFDYNRRAVWVWVHIHLRRSTGVYALAQTIPCFWNKCSI